MFIFKNQRSPYYKLAYLVNGKRRIISTKTSDHNKAQQFMSKFQIPVELPPVKSKINTLTSFRDECNASREKLHLIKNI